MLETICCFEYMRSTYALFSTAGPQSQTLHVTSMRIIIAYFMKLTVLERDWVCEYGNESSGDFKNREFLGQLSDSKLLQNDCLLCSQVFGLSYL